LNFGLEPVVFSQAFTPLVTMADNIEELKEIVAQTLESKGVLAKLRV
jgi:hypothetical protein